MAPTILTVGTALLACAGNAAAKKWYLADTYDASNFFDKFDFFESRFDTGDYNDVDPTSGHVNYQSRENAIAKGLAAYKNGEVYIGTDSKTVLPGANKPGRPSVRLESKARFNHGLLIARFSHLPENKCGTWPAFWSYGKDWPNDGEIDMYEEWNNSPINQPTFHTNNSPKYGQCILDGEGQTSGVLTGNCDNGFSNPPFQYTSQGCVSAETGGPWASKDGGVYAMEWTSDYIKMFKWTWNQVPSNIGTDSPDTATWGTPSVYLKNKHCDIDRHFADQKLILNIDFCGIPPALPEIWGQSCAAVTKSDTCIDYVSKNPKDFENVYFQIKDIRYFAATAPPVSSSSSSSSTSVVSTSTSSSALTSSTSSAALSTSSASSTSSAALSTSSASSTSSAVLSTSSASSTSSSLASSTSSLVSSSTFSSVVVSSTPASTASSDSSSAVSSASSDAISSTSASSSESASVTPGASSTVSASESGSDAASSTTASTESASASGFPSSTLVPTSRWSNSSTAAVPTTTQGPSESSIEMTTSTVYTTSVHTITKCPPWVKCPAGGLTVTKTIPLYTTVCPVSKATSTAATTEPSVTTGAETITTTISSIYTVTSCPPSVTNCPVGHVTTEVITTTYCPGAKETQPPVDGPKTLTTTTVYTITSCPPSVPNCPIGSVTTGVVTTTQNHPGQSGQTDVPHQSGHGSLIVSSLPPASQTAAVVKPSGSHNNGTTPLKVSPIPVHEACTGAGCHAPASGAGKMGASALAIAAGALVALMM